MVEVAQAGPLTNPFDLLVKDLPLPGTNSQIIGPWPDRIQGNITLQGRIWSPASNPVDVKIEALVYNQYTNEWDRILHGDGDGTIIDLGLLVPSVAALDGPTHDKSFTVISPPVELTGMGVKVTGVGSNGADTMVSVYYQAGGGVIT